MGLETLRRSIRPERPLIAKELMVFKLGLDAKSPKAVEITLFYLVVSDSLSRNAFRQNLLMSVLPTCVSIIKFSRQESSKFLFLK
jgi:hypothetical protein